MDSNLRFWPLQTSATFGQMHQICVRLKVWFKFEICDHCGSAKHKIWTSAKKNQLPWKFKCTQIRFLTIADLRNKKRNKTKQTKKWQKNWVMLKVWFKFEIFDHRGPAKHEIWPNAEIRVKNWDFWPSRTCVKQSCKWTILYLILVFQI